MSFLNAATGGAIGALTSAWGVMETNRANKGMVHDQINFQDHMSRTAHQRQVTDLKKAGLNPILSAGGSGASTPSGASTTMGNVAGTAVNSARANYIAGLQAKNLKEQQGLINNQSYLATQQALKAAAEREQVMVNTKNASLLTPELQNAAKVSGSEAGKIMTWIDRFSKSVGGATSALGVSRGRSRVPYR
ncbi:DNA pilot protein [Microviridae sp.]|nr:DNA pilot protein [Microviridae sp.]